MFPKENVSMVYSALAEICKPRTSTFVTPYRFTIVQQSHKNKIDTFYNFQPFFFDSTSFRIFKVLIIKYKTSRKLAKSFIFWVSKRPVSISIVLWYNKGKSISLIYAVVLCRSTDLKWRYIHPFFSSWEIENAFLPKH